jgi:murein DD-endopeptidase MepM/ murein hydrolase activator NlpD
MRHARKAAALVKTTLFTVTLIASTATAAQAIDSPGGTSAPTTQASAPSTNAKSSGGTAVTASKSGNTVGSVGSMAPSTKGTGGSEYGVPVRKTPAAHKATTRKPTHTVHRPHGVPKKKVTPTKPTTPAAPPVVSTPGAPSPAQTVGEGAVFPVLGAHSFGDAANRFGAGRVGHIHEGQDVLANEGIEVLAPIAGTIITTAYQAGSAGWYAAEHSVDGLDFFYAHCQTGSLAISTGQAVSAGQAICKVGQTGDATGPHLHFEIWVGGWQAAGGHPIDPLPYLEAWDRAVSG